MSSFVTHRLVPLLMIVTLASNVRTFDSMGFKPSACTYATTYKVLAADCANGNLKRVPKTLRSNIEAFLGSTNRIRVIDDLVTYSQLRFAYLDDNMIASINERVFVELPRLEVLDVAANGLTSLPKSLFRGAAMRKIYAANNSLLDFDDVTDAAARLEYLDFANNQLTRLPRFGTLPNLYMLNVTNNPIELIVTSDLVPYCRLTHLYMNGVTNHVRGCECARLRYYIALANLTVHVDDGQTVCDEPYDTICHVSLTTDEARTRASCLQQAKSLAETDLVNERVYTPAVLVVVLIAALLALVTYGEFSYCFTCNNATVHVTRDSQETIMMRAYERDAHTDLPVKVAANHTPV